MTETNSTKFWRKVTDPQAAKILTDWRERRFLEPFMGSPKTMSEVATSLGVKLNTMHYRVEQLRRLGLLRVVGTRKGRGRAAKLYGPTAEAFFVSFHVTPHLSLERMLHHLGALEVFVDNAAETLSRQADDWGVLVAVDALQGVSVRLAPLDGQGVPRPIHISRWLSADFPALLETEALLYLDQETAKSLQRDLVGLLQRYEQQAKLSGQAYMLLLGLTPIQRHKEGRTR